MTSPRATPQSPKVLDRALEVLELFTDRQPEWTVADIASSAGLPTSTAYRIVGALTSHGLLRTTTAGRLRLGVAAMTLGLRASRAFDLSVILRPELQRLSEATGETTTLSVFDPQRLKAVCVDRFETENRLRLSLEIGAALPLHAGAASLALLAFLDNDVVERVLHSPLEAVTPRTITDPEQLRAEMERIRQRGWAHSYEATTEGAWGVGAPILGGDGIALAALGVSGPLGRHSEEVERRAIAETLAAAERGAAALGGALPAGSYNQGSATEGVA